LVGGAPMVVGLELVAELLELVAEPLELVAELFENMLAECVVYYFGLLCVARCRFWASWGR